MKNYRITITSSVYNENYLFTTPADGEIADKIAAIVKEMENGNISKFTVEEVSI